MLVFDPSHARRPISTGARPPRWLARLVSAVALGTCLAAGACDRPPVDPDGGQTVGDGRIGPIAFSRFAQDRPVIGGDWYLYDEEGGHSLTPFDQVYLIRDLSEETPRYGAVRLLSYYDPNTADSGVFSWSARVYEGQTWTAQRDFLASKNIKSDGPLCFDFFAGPADARGQEVSCDGADWQIMFKTYRFLVTTGPIVVARPGLFLRQAPRVQGLVPITAATIEGAGGLDDLGDPTVIEDLQAGPPAGWTTPRYDLSKYAPNLPTAGRVLGARFVTDSFFATGDVFFLLNATGGLVRFTVSPTVDGDASAGLSFSWGVQEVNREDATIADATVEMSSAQLPMPGDGEMVFIDFDAPDLRLDRDVLDEAAPPDRVPLESIWELAAVGTDDGRVELLVSPGSALYNASALDGAVSLDDAVPPL